MKWLLIIFLSCPVAAQDAPLQVFHVPNFNAGVVTRYSPILIPDNSVQDARNVYFDEYGVTRRKGYSQFNSTALTDTKSVRGIWSYTSTDGSRYIVALSSQTIFSSPTTGVFTAISGLSSLSATADMDAVAYLGKIWFANGVDSMAYWTGTSTAAVSEGPLGNMIEGWRNRIVTAGVAGSLSYVYMSKELDGEEWTTGPTATGDPVAIAIGGTNAKPIKCVYAGFKDFLFIGNEDEIYGVYGFGQDDFVVRTISKEVGCIEDKSVQEKDGALYWLSRRGIEKMSSQAGVDRISDGVKDVFDTLIGNTSVNRIKLYSTQAEWELGNLTAAGVGAPLSATISAGNVVPSTFSHSVDSAAEWAAGTIVQLDTTTTAGSIQLAYDGTITLIDQFTDSNYTSNPTWTCSGTCNWLTNIFVNTCVSGGGKCLTNEVNSVTNYTATFVTPYISKHYGDWKIRVGWLGYEGYVDYFFVSDSNSSGNANGYSFRASGFFDAGSHCDMTYTLYRVDAGVQVALDTEAAVVSGVCSFAKTFDITRNTSGGITIKEGSTTLLTSTSTTHTGDTSHLIAKTYTRGYDTSEVYTQFTDVYAPKAYYSSGTWTSATYNTGFSTPIGGPYYFEHTVPAGSTVAYQIAQSSNGVTFDAWQTVPAASSTTWKIPLVKQYWKEKITLSTSYSTQTPSVEYVSLQAATTGAYIHDCVQTNSISSWGLFQANTVIDDGYSDTLPSVVFYVSTGTTCDSVERATATWNLQSNNAPISISTAAFLGIKEIFTIDAATQTAMLRDVTVNWLEGTVRPPVASSVYLNRYYLSYTTSSASGLNDFMFVADKNDAPTFLDNMNCYSLALFNRRMYCGDANNTGKIFQMETGESDDGSPFTSYFRTKAYHFGDPDAEKEFVKMYADFAPEADSVLNIDITPSYRLDLSTTSITLGDVDTGEDATAGMLVSKIPFAVSNNLTGRFLDVKFTNTNSEGNWTLFGLSFYFRKYDVK